MTREECADQHINVDYADNAGNACNADNADVSGNSDMCKSSTNEKPVQRVQQMYEYGYRKSNYGPDELVTDAHGNPISVVDAMLSADDAAKKQTHTPHLCFYSPRIPGNTGSAIRLCAVTGTILHLVEPLGFNLHDTKLRRAGLDYHDMAHVVIHPDFNNLVESMPNSRIIAFTANATKLYTDIEYKPTDILLLDRSQGIFLILWILWQVLMLLNRCVCLCDRHCVV